MFQTLNRTQLTRWLISALLALVVCAVPSASLGQVSLVKSVLIVQVLGNQSDKYVAGKDAVILVTLNEKVPVAAATQKVTLKLGGADVTTLEPSPAADATDILVFNCPNRAACGDWKAGSYTAEADINGSKGEAKATFQERSGIRVLAVGVNANYGAGDVRNVTGIWKNMAEHTRQVYPVAPDKFHWIHGQDVDASDIKFNLKTSDGQKETFLALANLQPFACHEKPRPAEIASQCYDKIVGFVKDRQGEQANLQGYTMGYGTNVVTESDEDAPATVAHELGHGFVLGDEYKGGSFHCKNNPPPPDYVGKDWDNRENTSFNCKESKSEDGGGGGSLINASVEFPFEVGGRGLLPNMVSFMGSGFPQARSWISPASWSQIFDGLDPAKKTSTLKRAAPRLAVQTRWIYASGFIARNGKVTVEPWYAFEDPYEHQDATGKPYTIRAVDAQNAPLASDALDVSFTADAHASPRDEAYFEVVLPFPEKTAAFQILNGTQVIHTVKVSANAPTVKVTAPAAGQTLNGAFTLKWEASDKDNDKLYYFVEFSTDGKEWVTLAADLEKPEWAENFNDIPGSDKPTARIRVTATDGINAAEAESGLFSVPPKAPEVYIEDPKPIAAFKVGSEVILDGWAYDLQDDEILDDELLVWTSSMQGELGKGSLLYVDDLKVGRHVITLKATNSFKLSSSAAVTITITEGTPPPPVGAPAPTRAPTTPPTPVPPTPVPPTATRPAPTNTPVPPTNAPAPAPTTTVVAIVVASPTAAPVQPPAAQPPAATGDNNTGLIIGGLIALVVIGGIAFFVMRRK